MRPLIETRLGRAQEPKAKEVWGSWHDARTKLRAVQVMSARAPGKVIYGDLTYMPCGHSLWGRNGWPLTTELQELRPDKSAIPAWDRVFV